MSSLSLEQIWIWFTRTLWPLLEGHKAVLGATLAGLLLFILFLIGKLKKSVPGIADARVRVEPCDLPPCRFFTGTIVGFNKGRKSCRLLGLQLMHRRFQFEISDVTDRRDKELTAPERGTIGVRLPIEIEARRKKNIYFFGYHRIATLSELPDTLSLKVTFKGRKKTLLYSLVRVLDETYCLRPPDRYPPERVK